MKKTYIILCFILLIILVAADVGLYFEYSKKREEQKTPVGAENLRVKWTKFVWEEKDNYTLAALIENPNKDWEAEKMEYKFTIYNGKKLLFSKNGFAYAAPGGNKFIIENSVNIIPEPTAVSLALNIIKWKKINPAFVDLNLGARQLEYSISNTRGESGFARLKGVISNKTAYDLSLISIDIILYDEKYDLLAGSTVIMEELKANSEKSFTKIWQWPIKHDPVYFDVFPGYDALKQKTP